MVLAGCDKKINNSIVASLVAGRVEGDNLGEEGLDGGRAAEGGQISLELLGKRGVVFEVETGREVR